MNIPPTLEIGNEDREHLTYYNNWILFLSVNELRADPDLHSGEAPPKDSDFRSASLWIWDIIVG